MMKEAIKVSGAIAAATFLAPRIANRLTVAELDDGSGAVRNTLVINGARFGAGLLAYFVLGRFVK